MARFTAESAKLRALRAKNVLTCQRALRAQLSTCLGCLRANMPYLLTCSRGNVPCGILCPSISMP